MHIGTPKHVRAIALVLLVGACSSPVASVARAHAPAASDPASAASGLSEAGRTPGHAAVVTRTVDGDTIYVRYRGREIDVRLIGVDTPETVDPTQPVGCYGPQASHFTERTLTGEPIRLEFDVERHDRYGRVLAYVWLRGRLFNQRLAAQGYAVVSTYPPNVRYESRFEAAQAIAMRDDRGLWGACPVGHTHRCDPAYPGVCIPSPPPDLDCADVTFRNFQVLPPDPHNFDGNHDGIGCES
jgi:micrococcal nuclease